MIFAPIFSVLLVVGSLIWGRDFLSMLYTFTTSGIPTAWDRHVAANRYYRAFKTAFKIAIGLPILGTVMALFCARSHLYMNYAQLSVFITFLPSAAIFGVLLFLANVFAAIATTLFVPEEERRQAVREIRVGLQREVSVYLSWELTIGYIFFLIGTDATLWVLGVSVWGIILYVVVTYAFNWRVAWAPYVMATLGLGGLVVMIILLVVMIFPTSRRYAASWGIKPGKFVHMGVVDTTTFIDADKEVATKLKELCEIDVNEIKSKIIKAQDTTALLSYQKQLRKKEQECL